MVETGAEEEAAGVEVAEAGIEVTGNLTTSLTLLFFHCRAELKILYLCEINFPHIV